MMLLRLVSSLLLVLAAAPALAIDPGVVEGSLQINATRTYKLTQAYAFRDKNELRIVLADREAPTLLLPDLNFQAVAQAAREGRLHGLYVRVNTINQKDAVVSVLHPGVFSNVSGAVYGLTMAGNRVAGQIDSGPARAEVQYGAKFSAPVFTPGAKR